MKNQFIPSRLAELASAVHATAVEKGWHEKENTDRTYRMLVITEVAEAVEADRKGLYGNTEEYKKTLEIYGRQKMSSEGLDALVRKYYYDKIKPSREAEMADIVIRLLDFAYAKYGNEIDWGNVYIVRPLGHFCFADNADLFIEEVLGTGSMNIASSILYLYEWANLLDFDLEWHIEQKMRYNKGRSYHHGGKAY